jgi:hypothetical protein
MRVDAWSRYLYQQDADLMIRLLSSCLAELITVVMQSQSTLGFFFQN